MGTKIVYSLFIVKNKIERESMDKQYVDKLSKFLLVTTEKGELKYQSCNGTVFEIDHDCYVIYDAEKKRLHQACIGIVFFKDVEFLYLNVHIGIDDKPIIRPVDMRFARNVRLDRFVLQTIEKAKKIYLGNRKTTH